MSCPTPKQQPDGSTAPCPTKAYVPGFVGLHGNNIDTARLIASTVRTVVRSALQQAEIGPDNENQIAQDILQALAELNGGNLPKLDVSIYPEEGVVNLDYSRACFEYGTVEAACRGLYIDYRERTPDGILLLPPGKFYNYGEPQAPTLGDVRAWCADGRMEGVFYRKIDGTMILARVDEDGKIIAGTRQKLDSLYVQQAREHFERLQIARYMRPGYTYMFECKVPLDIDPFGEEKVDCDPDGLYLLLCRDHADGTLRVGEEVEELQGVPGLFHPQQARFDDLHQAADSIRALTDTEGYVCSIPVQEKLPDGSVRAGRVLWKFKTDWWRNFTHLLSSAQMAERMLSADNLSVRIREFKDADERFWAGDDLDKQQEIIGRTLRRLVRRVWGDDLYAYLAGDVEAAVERITAYHDRASAYVNWLFEKFPDQEGSAPEARLNQMRRFLFDRSRCLESDVPFAMRGYVINLVESCFGKKQVTVGNLLWAQRNHE